LFFLSLLLAYGFRVSSGAADTPMKMTPLLLSVHDAPVPFTGSDGRIHLAYEVWITNFSSGDVVLGKIEVLGDDAVVQSLDAPAIAARLQPLGTRESSGTMAKSSQSVTPVLAREPCRGCADTEATLSPCVREFQRRSSRISTHR
jgi:hypothetical protein